MKYHLSVVRCLHSRFAIVIETQNKLRCAQLTPTRCCGFDAKAVETLKRWLLDEELRDDMIALLEETP